MSKDGLHNKDMLAMMGILKEYDYGKFIEVLYKSIESFPERIKHDPYPLEQKIGALYKIIEYYEREDIQEFRKCAFIKNIIDELNKDDISNSSK